MAILNLQKQNPCLPRVRALMAFMLLGLSAITARLWYLQIAHGEELWQASIGNERRLIRRLAPRGEIDDRYGKVVATNRYEIVVSVVPEEAKKNPGPLPLLSQLLNIPQQDLAATIEANKVSAFDPVRVAEDIDVATATRIEEQHLNLPGVVVAPEPIRFYPDGSVFGHVMGQMGQISKEELKERKDEGYRPGDYCGRLGMERAYDQYLRGIDGGREVQVDARGRMRRDLGDTEPIPGATLTLNIDKAVQKAAYDELYKLKAQGKAGAAVAIDPSNGAVIALVSVPAYDPNLFVKGISKTNWAKIASDPLKPQTGRAVSGAFAPGSTFKLVTSIAGLEAHKTSLQDKTYCSGVMMLGHWAKHCYKPGGHGEVSLLEAIQKSCDIFFYRLGQRLGPETLASYARRMGLGSRTGIDLIRKGDPQIERKGIVPDPEWKQRVYHQEWLGGETVDYGIGQAMLAVTPIQMCNMVATIANGGTVYKPQLVKTITRYDEHNKPHVVHEMKPIVLKRSGISPQTLAIVKQGMRMVMQPGGTAYSASIPGLDMGGKTGTAQVRHKGNMVNNAWFVGVAPLDKPKIAVCVFVERGGHGGVIAAPIARKMITTYLHLKAGDSGAPGTTD